MMGSSKKRFVSAGITAVAVLAFSAGVFASGSETQIKVSFNDIKVTINGQTAALKDENGNAVEPFNYNGTVYLPLRAISQALGKTISYDSATNTVNITGGNTNGTPPEGPPPDGAAQGGAPAGAAQGNGDSVDSKTVTGTGKYSQMGGTAAKADITINAAEADESAIKVTDCGIFKLTGSTITKAGDSSSTQSSDFTGLNAAVLAEASGAITLEDCTITTNAEGANGVFATSDGSTITLSNVQIITTQNSSRGVDATYNGIINGTNLDITTSGEHCAAIATDRGEGRITITGGTMNTAGAGSPPIYSTGNITVSDASLTATGSEAAVIEGKNSITVNNCIMTGAKRCGAMLYQSFSGDAGVGTSSFTMNGGSLTANVGPVFYSTNTKAVINLKKAILSSASGILAEASADRWGTSGSNGAELTLNADSQELTGDVVCDEISSINVVLKNKSVLKGNIDSENTAGSIALKLDSTSSWNITGDSHVSSLSDSDLTLSNIRDNGHNIYYDPENAANSWLGGRTMSLSDGGKLVPENK